MWGGVFPKPKITMPFTDTPDGQTHYQNDGCGVKAHNDMQEQKAWYEDLMCMYANRVEEFTGNCYRDGLREYTDSLVKEASRRGREQGLREARDAFMNIEENIYDPTPKNEVVKIGWDDARHAFLRAIDSLLSQQEGK